MAGSIRDHLAAALRGTRASAIALDLPSGSVLAAFGAAGGGTPGSTLKPLLLQYALDHGVVAAETKVYCRRDLRIGGRRLPCTHPRDQDVFTAQTALAASCNTYFAEVGRRLSGQQLDDALRLAGIASDSTKKAGVEQREMAVLGLEGTTVTPLQLARAYRRLALSLSQEGAVAKGMADSVRYGMADGASVAGISILGKTGTASNPNETWTHGWFAGFLPGRLVLVVFVPHGDGGTAAKLAHGFFAAMQDERGVRR